MSEPPEQREQTTEVNAGLHANVWFPVSFSVRRTVRKRWTDRIGRLAQDTAEASSMSLAEIAERVDRDERIGDLIAGASDRAATVADSEYRQALARLIAAGLRDDAKVDEATYYASVLMTLEPVHLRVLRSVAENQPDGGGAVDVAQVDGIGAPPAVAYSAAERLRSLGLLERMWEGGDGIIHMGEGVALVTDAGRALLAFCASFDENGTGP